MCVCVFITLDDEVVSLNVVGGLCIVGVSLSSIASLTVDKYLLLSSSDT